ncbi:hypothetical protein TNCV_3054091 [Trichonephila clavipes]|nr:hypothetical protein TNCV_3054091 [Trichonephila clavipes]
MLKPLRFDIFELQETKLPVRLIKTTNEGILVQGHKNPLRVKRDIEDVSSELDNGVKALSIIQVTVRISSRNSRRDDRWRHHRSPPPQFRHGTEEEGNILQSPCTREFSPEDFRTH